MTWDTSSVLALATVISSVLIAAINSRSQRKIHEKDIQHEDYSHWLDLQEKLFIDQRNIYYSDKKKAFSDFVNAAAVFIVEPATRRPYENVQTALRTAMLFCSRENYDLLYLFSLDIDEIFCSNVPGTFRKKYNQKLSDIAKSLNLELESTKPVVSATPDVHNAHGEDKYGVKIILRRDYSHDYHRK